VEVVIYMKYGLMLFEYSYFFNTDFISWRRIKLWRSKNKLLV